MACLLLFSSSGLTMDVHFCQGKFKRANIIGKAKTCKEVNACLLKCGKEVKSCSSSTSSCSAGSSHKDCCNNESILMDFDFDSSVVYTTVLTDANLQFVLAFASTYLYHEKVAYTFHNYQKYIPPLRDLDIRIHFQTFLI